MFFFNSYNLLKVDAKYLHPVMSSWSSCYPDFCPSVYLVSLSFLIVCVQVGSFNRNSVWYREAGFGDWAHTQNGPNNVNVVIDTKLKREYRYIIHPV